MLADTMWALMHAPHSEYPIATHRLAAHKLTLEDSIGNSR